MPYLTALFFVTAIVYASVGFGGGSTYNALLVLSGADFRVLPSVALTCNIIVVTGGVWHFSRAGHLQLKLVLPFLALSVPMAWLGGRLPIDERVFVGLLGLSLAFAGLRLLVNRTRDSGPAASPPAARMWAIGLPVGAAIGLLAGQVGIGGGIFLDPLLHVLHWGTARGIAAASSLFILINSVSGLAGQMMKLGDIGQLGQFYQYLWLFPAVLLGGQAGSLIGSRHLPGPLVRRLTAVVVLYVAARLLIRWYTMGGG